MTTNTYCRHHEPRPTHARGRRRKAAVARGPSHLVQPGRHCRSMDARRTGDSVRVASFEPANFTTRGDAPVTVHSPPRRRQRDRDFLRRQAPGCSGRRPAPPSSRGTAPSRRPLSGVTAEAARRSGSQCGRCRYARATSAPASSPRRPSHPLAPVSAQAALSQTVEVETGDPAQRLLTVSVAAGMGPRSCTRTSAWRLAGSSSRIVVSRRGDLVRVRRHRLPRPRR